MSEHIRPLRRITRSLTTTATFEDKVHNVYDEEDKGPIGASKRKAIEDAASLTLGSLVDAIYLSSHRLNAPSDAIDDIATSHDRYGEETDECTTELHGKALTSGNSYAVHGLYRHREEPGVLYAMDPSIHIALMTELKSAADPAAEGWWTNAKVKSALEEAWARTVRKRSEGEVHPESVSQGNAGSDTQAKNISEDRPVWMNDDLSVTLHGRKIFVLFHRTDYTQSSAVSEALENQSGRHRFFDESSAEAPLSVGESSGASPDSVARDQHLRAVGPVGGFRPPKWVGLQAQPQDPELGG